MTTVYDYVATTNPRESKSLCESFGYRVTNPETMSQNLKTLVNNEGEQAVKSIMEIHPDKDIILEYFAKPKEKEKSKPCGCGNKSESTKLMEQFLNANGKQDNKSEAQALATNTNTIIFASALVLAVAIIFKNDK